MKTLLRTALIRSKARKFAAEVKSQNMAMKVPEDLILWLEDADIPYFKTCLQAFGLSQRWDFRWEPTE